MNDSIDKQKSFSSGLRIINNLCLWNWLLGKSQFFCFCSVFFFFCFLGSNPRHMEVPRLGVQLELQLLPYATATAMQDPSCICNLHHSSRQCQILNLLSKARDWTCILTETMWDSLPAESQLELQNCPHFLTAPKPEQHFASLSIPFLTWNQQIVSYFSNEDGFIQDLQRSAILGHGEPCAREEDTFTERKGKLGRLQ